MTIQEILYNAGTQKKLQYGGTATGTVEGIQDDLAKKTIRDDTMVAKAQGIAGGAPSPSLAASTIRKGPAGLLAGSKQEPVHVIIDKGGTGGGNGLMGKIDNLAGGMADKLFGIGKGIFKNFAKVGLFGKKQAATVAAAPGEQPVQEQPVQAVQKGGLLYKSK